MKDRDLKAGDLIRWKGSDTALVLSVSEPPPGFGAKASEAAAVFDDGKVRYIPGYLWTYVEVVKS